MAGPGEPEACATMAFALEEFRAALDERDEMRRRQVAEKAWLAVTEATDHYLGQVGIVFPADIEPAEMHRFRRTRLEDMKDLGHVDAERVLGSYLDLRDALHGDCFYGGGCDRDTLTKYLVRARNFVADITGCRVPSVPG